LYDTLLVRSHEFVARARRYAKAYGLEFSFDTKRGKGSHSVLRIGNLRTVVKHGEIGKGLVSRMLKQLGISPVEF
jgi:mRNA interferase HicA